MNQSTAFRPDGGLEIPGFDPDWETRVKHVEDEDLDPLQLPIAEGETLPFVCMLFLEGSPSSTCSVRVSAPENSIGGFMLQGVNGDGDYETLSFGADDFNSNVGSLQCGIAGTLASWHTVRIEGLVGAGAPGIVRVQAIGATVAKPGSFLKDRRLYDSRGYA